MTRLSPEQLTAVKSGPGPVRVVAGAGTGKTTVIVERFVRLVQQGVEPSSILLMTFTERAAREMRARIGQRLGDDAAPWVGTFHAVAQRWLREDGRRVGVPVGFQILSGADRWILMWSLLWRLGDDALVAVEHPEHQVGALLRTLERLKQELIPVARLRAAAARDEDESRSAVLQAAARLFAAYAAECRRQRLLDFDDLLERAVRLLESSPAVLAEYRARFPWVLVDEYQDTNLAQERVVELLAAESGQVFVVGDDDQSIYRFRGASRASLERFASSFPTQTTVPLTRNRRSSARIVRCAAQMVERNPDRVAKSLRATLPSGPRVQVTAFERGAEEARAIARQIAEMIGAGVAHPGGIAVLTRTNAVATPVVDALRAAGVPCRVSASTGFFLQPAVKDLVAALRLVRDEGDVVAGERLQTGLGRLDAARWSALRTDLARKAEILGVGDVFFDLMERSAFLESTEPEPALRFSELVSQFCERASDQSLPRFLEHLDLLELSGIEPDAEFAKADQGGAGGGDVSVMTIHQAKGLEFDIVFVPSLVEGRLPQPSRRDRFVLPPAVLEPSVRGREDHVAEERRLCYVALTRARRGLHLSWARRYEGDRVWQRSRFLDELVGGSAADIAERVGDEPVPPEVQGGGAERPATPGGAVPRRSRPRPEPLIVSFSGLSTYRTCPRQHWYRYVRRLPSRESAEAFLGDAVHRALMAAAKLKGGAGTLSAARMRALVAEAWGQRPFPEPRTEGVYKRLAADMTVRYSQNGGLAGRLFNVEHPFETPLNGATLKGVIDRIDEPQQPGGPYVLIDYKTGSPLPASGLRRDFQLALYALGARRELGLNLLELEIVYLREDKRVRIQADDALIEDAETNARQVIAGIESGEFSARPEPRRCRVCAYRLACDSAV